MRVWLRLRFPTQAKEEDEDLQQYEAHNKSCSEQARPCDPLVVVKVLDGVTTSTDQLASSPFRVCLDAVENGESVVAAEISIVVTNLEVRGFSLVYDDN
jgi:hypothetical protein